MTPVDRKFHINGYQLAALEWNPSGSIKVLATHGWLDNAASFIHLAPLLQNCHVIALDVSGHGHSDHKSLQSTYNIWDDLLDFLAVADALDWQTFNLLGHSRGAIMSLLLAAAMPERIESLVMLDGLVPQPVAIEDTVKQLSRFLKNYSRPRSKNSAGFDAVEEAVALRCEAIAMSESSARPIVERGLLEVDGRYYWRSDPRLTYASAIKFSKEHNKAILAALSVPNLLLVTEEGVGSYEYFRELLAENPHIAYQQVAGSHHFHMETPVVIVAEAINDFYRQQLSR